ncbi:MAG: hypothetical protein Tsb0018_05100 [Opitutales bacterium]
MAERFSSVLFILFGYILSFLAFTQASAVEIEILSSQVDKTIGVGAALKISENEDNLLRSKNEAIDAYIEGRAFLTTTLSIVFPEGHTMNLMYFVPVRLRLDTVPFYLNEALQFIDNVERPEDTLLDQALAAMREDLFAMREELNALRPEFARGRMPSFDRVQVGHRFFQDFVRRYKGIRSFLFQLRDGLLNDEPAWFMPAEDLVDAWGFAQHVLEPDYQTFYNRVMDIEQAGNSSVNLYVRAILVRARLESIVDHIARLHDLLGNTPQDLALADWLNALSVRIAWLINREVAVPLKLLNPQQQELFVEATRYALDEFTTIYTIITQGPWVQPHVDLRARVDFHRMWNGLNDFWRSRFDNEMIPLEVFPIANNNQNIENPSIAQQALALVGALFVQCINPANRHNGGCGGGCF